jgi:hypothetical protein
VPNTTAPTTPRSTTPPEEEACTCEATRAAAPTNR